MGPETAKFPGNSDRAVLIRLVCKPSIKWLPIDRYSMRYRSNEDSDYLLKGPNDGYNRIIRLRSDYGMPLTSGGNANLMSVSSFPATTWFILTPPIIDVHSLTSLWSVSRGHLFSSISTSARGTLFLTLSIPRLTPCFDWYPSPLSAIILPLEATRRQRHSAALSWNTSNVGFRAFTICYFWFEH